jgi:hypothetical protein
MSLYPLNVMQCEQRVRYACRDVMFVAVLTHDPQAVGIHVRSHNPIPCWWPVFAMEQIYSTILAASTRQLYTSLFLKVGDACFQSLKVFKKTSLIWFATSRRR